MSRYSHFTTKERESLLALVKSGKKNCEIARLLGGSPSTISRELRRNAYSAIEAEEKYRTRRRRCVRKQKLASPTCAEKVSELLNCYWSPEQISNRLRQEKNQIRISTCTIYRALKNGLLPLRSWKRVFHAQGAFRQAWVQGLFC